MRSRTRRVFLYHSDERVRSIITQGLVKERGIVLHPAETPEQLRSTASTVPTCRESVFLLEFSPDSQVQLHSEVKSICPFSEVILLISAAHTPEAAALVENGVVYDYLIVNPFYDVYTARIKIFRALERCYLKGKLVELQKQLMAAKNSIKPAVECLTTDLSQGVRRDSSKLKEGVSEVVKGYAPPEQIDGIFCHFDSRLEEKLSEFGENVVVLTDTFADGVTNKAVETVGEVVNPPTPSEKTISSEEQKDAQRILVISESSKDRDLLRAFLSAQGFEVIEETGGEESIERAVNLSPPPALILLDMDLKDRKSFKILSLLFKTESLKGIPVILLTRTKTKEILKKAVKYGVAGIILKPFKFSVVKEKVEQVLGSNSENEDGKKEDTFFIRWRRGETL